MPNNQIGQYDFADKIVKAMEAAVVGSRVELRGSLATKLADRYSDIDLRWIVPDDHLDDALERFSQTLEQVGQLASLRTDRQFQRSKKRRLIFVRFREVALFWRVDIEVLAASIKDDSDYDVGNADAWGEEWSPTDSALMNALAAIKAVRRNQPDIADGLLERGYDRVGLAQDVRLACLEQIIDLTNGIRELDPSLNKLSRQIEQLAREELQVSPNIKPEL